MPQFFIEYDPDISFMNKVDKISQFCKLNNGKFPQNNPNDKEETQLNDFLNKARTSFNNGNLMPNRESYCRANLPAGCFKNDQYLSENKFKSYIADLKNWFT